MIHKKKLFFIINRLVLGGHSADVVSLAHHLTGKYEITILYGEKETEELEISAITGNPDIAFIKIPSLHRSLHPWQDTVAFRQILLLLKKNNPSLVHTHGFKSGLLGRLAAKKAGIPVIIHTYHGHLFHSYYNRFISSVICNVERWLATMSTYIIAISLQQAHELSQMYRIAPTEKIKIIFIGIDKENYESSDNNNDSLRKKYSIPNEVVIVAIIGRLVPIKNHSFFVDIAQRILQSEKQVCFFVIGDGNQKSLIQKKLTERYLPWQETTEKNTDTLIYFTSWVTDIASALVDIDIVLLTSLNEGTPVSLIEAQLFGKPVVATNAGGVRDTIIDNETGFLIDRFDVDDFVKKLRRLIHDKELRDKMGNKGKVFAAQRFSKEKEVAAIDLLYTNCLQHKSETV